jgi:endonuclease YncB( thermonuclease family)
VPAAAAPLDWKLEPKSGMGLAGAVTRDSLHVLASGGSRKMNKLIVGLAGAILLACAWPAHADEIAATVVGISDGDTITVLTPAHKQVRVRLAEIDAPEAKQPWGQRAKQTLGGLVFGKQIKIVTRGTDRYGRTLGRLYVGSLYVNAEMVRAGAAWAYEGYLTDYTLVSLEAEARKNARGLWAMPAGEIVAPWDWRHNRQSESTKVGTQAGGVCGGKQYCREMSSCAEAQFYLHKCGVSRLDGDGDGVACEALCR